MTHFKLVLALFSVLAINTVYSESTLTPEEDCAKGNASCSDCLDRGVKCLWCNSADKHECLVYPAGQVIPHKDVCKLNDARWGTCSVNYLALLICMGLLAGVILLTCCCCLYCCCCRTKDKSKKYAKQQAEIEKERFHREERNANRKSERKERLDGIRKKYGLNKKDNEYERMDD